MGSLLYGQDHEGTVGSKGGEVNGESSESSVILNFEKVILTKKKGKSFCGGN